MKIYAADCETVLIAPRAGVILHPDSIEHVRAGPPPAPVSGVDPPIKRRNVQFTEPFVAPELVCGSIATDATPAGQVMVGSEMVGAIIEILTPHPDDEEPCHLVFHNLAFDYQVLVKAGVPKKLFLDAAAQGRLHDTMYLDLLKGLADGTYDTPLPPEYNFIPMRPRSLDVLARTYAGMELTKDPEVRLGYGAYLGKPLSDYPENFITYARQDAEATYKVFLALQEYAAHGERIQVANALTVAEMDVVGVHIDRAEAQRLKVLFEQDVPELRAALISARLAFWEPAAESKTSEKFPLEDGDWSPSWHLCDDGLIRRTKLFKKHMVKETARPHFHLLQSNVRAALQRLADRPGFTGDAPTTETGLLSLDAEWWKDYIPANYDSLVAWEKHEKLKKIIGTYLRLYSEVDQVYPRWNIMGARSGRMSCSSPNAQNVPKHRHGIRSLFRPRSGACFVVADYSAQEVFTLCEAMAGMGIRGPLFDVLASGDDLHYANAERLFRRPRAEITKLQRQLAKVLIFGVGGGLGPAKLALTAKKDYGLSMSFQEAKEAKGNFLRIFPDIAEYLDRLKTDFNANLIALSGRGKGVWRQMLGVQENTLLALRKAMLRSPEKYIRGLVYAAERTLEVILPTGRRRKGCSFTEGANTYFQGLAAEVTKLAGFYCTADDLRVVLLVHDEIVVEAVAEKALEVKSRVEYNMLKAFREVCPTVGQFARVEADVRDKWGAATSKDGVTI